MVSKLGQAILFNEQEVRDMGRSAGGVRGMNLREGDEVIGMQLCLQGEYLLTVTEYGMGKRTELSEFKGQKRGGYGLRTHRVNEKTGNLVSAKLVDSDKELLLITNDGIVIRIKVGDISVIGRNTSGVKLMNIDRSSGAKVVTVTKVSASGEEEDDFPESGEAQEAGEMTSETEASEAGGMTSETEAEEAAKTSPETEASEEPLE